MAAVPSQGPRRYLAAPISNQENHRSPWRAKRIHPAWVVHGGVSALSPDTAISSWKDSEALCRPDIVRWSGKGNVGNFDAEIRTLPISRPSLWAWFRITARLEGYNGKIAFRGHATGRIVVDKIEPRRYGDYIEETVGRILI